MKIIIIVFIDFLENEEIYPSITHDVRSRRYEINSSDDLKDALNNMAGDIELQIENKQFNKSDLRVHGIDKIIIQYDRYNPTRVVLI
jgi:RNAse (barnase) inhibitor barstar